MLENNKRKSLGRGLNALLGEDDISFESLESSAQQDAKTVDINRIRPSRFQPRTEFDEEALNALVQSIKEKGVLQPLIVRRKGQEYEIIAGERRWRASKAAGLIEVPVIEKDLSDKEVLEVALVENLLRENLSAIEEAEAFQQLMKEFSHTQEAISQIVGKSRSHVANMLRLLTLPDDVKKLVKENKLSAGHAKVLVGLDNAAELAQKVIKKDLSVRAVEDMASKIKNPKSKIKNHKDGDVEDLEKDLKEALGLRISISPSKNGGGKVVLQYASVAELDMIIDILQQKNGVFKAPATNDKFTMKVI